MESTIEAVSRAIETMRENLGEPLTVDDMARSAMFSKFHFSRFFQKVTGVSPGRFLSAMRLEAAKELLVTTSLTVTEISHKVGYASVGTFSSRFTMSVGVSPTTYRQLDGFRTDPVRKATPAPPARPTVRGEVVCPQADPDHGLVFVGLFSDPIPKGQPVRCAVLHGAGSFRLDRVPHGTWYLLAHSFAAGLERTAEQPVCLGTHGPVRVSAETSVEEVEVRLERTVPDPELFKALLDVRAVAVKVGAA